MRSLTVGVLNLNEASLTIDVLDKVALLSKAGWDTQLIVVDNGSSDDQVQCLTDWFLANKGQFAEASFIAASRNLGCTGGRNVILKLAAGEAILILDNDVILPSDPDWLNTLCQKLETDPKVGIVGPMLVFSDYPEIVQAAGIGLTDSGRVGYLNRADPVESVPTMPVQVIATPATWWLLRTEAQQSVGLFSEDYYPVQYEDVDFCVRLGLEGWKIICDRSVKIAHIGNVTTRNLSDHPFARLTVRNAMRFRQKWASVLPQIATLGEEEIYWGPIPRPAEGG
jgi:GT2 family glycosyltransferase